MDIPRSGIDRLENDPVLRFLLDGTAKNLDEAEEMCLDTSMPELLRLLESSLTDEELVNHPLFALLRSHGSRGWEDSVL